MIFLGIDPGVSGAIAVIGANTVEFYDTPVVQVKVGKGLKNQLDGPKAALMLQSLTSGDDSYLIIESVQPMPSIPGKDGERRSMGATSAFSFGRDFGRWLGILDALQIRYELVHPARWKRQIMQDMGKEKDASRIKAMQLYPKTAQSLNLKKHHGRADALLLAEFGRRTYFGPSKAQKSQDNVLKPQELPF